jgi:hypothetical protein
VATALWERHGIRTLRRSLAELAGGAELGAGGDLRVGGARIAVVYFRAGYSPDDYPTEAEWRARSVPYTLQQATPTLFRAVDMSEMYRTLSSALLLL